MLVVGISALLIGAPSGADTGFDDVPSDHPFHNEITWLVDEGITTGFPDGFRPTNDVTRQAVAAFLYRYESPRTVMPEYPDDVNMIVEVEGAEGPLDGINVQVWSCLEAGFDCERIPMDQSTRSDGSVGFVVEPPRHPAYYSAVVQEEVDGLLCTWGTPTASFEDADDAVVW